MTSATNLALGKPALQSSTSEWSRYSEPPRDAAGGNDGDTNCAFGFHTDWERNPWWQVDLEAYFIVTSLAIHNRLVCSERARRFSVLGSLDGQDWDLLYAKMDDSDVGSADGAPFIVSTLRKLPLRFLRIRLDGEQCLHLRECEVFGFAVPAPSVEERAASAAGAARFVFAALYNESESFLPHFIANFLHYTGPESVLVINLPPGRQISDDMRHTSNRVHFFNGRTARAKFGHTLLVGHLESFEFASTAIGAFDYFCTIASNSLFVRHFDAHAVIRQIRAGYQAPPDAEWLFAVNCDIDHLPEGWFWWSVIKRSPVFLDILKRDWGFRRLSQNQIEGLTASKQDWRLLHDRLADIQAAAQTVKDEDLFPVEEVLPVSSFFASGTGLYTNICQVLWPRGNVRFADLLGMPERYPAYICMMKWFDRNEMAFETALVTQPWARQLLTSLQDLHRAHKAEAVVAQRFLLEAFSGALRSRETTRPVSACWWPDGWTAPRRLAFDQSLQALRQKVELQADGLGVERFVAFLLLEETGHAFDVHVAIEEDSATCVTLCCKGRDHALDPAPEGDLEGYLYLRTGTPDAGATLRARLPRGKSSTQGEQPLRAVLSVAGHYELAALVHTAETSDHQEFYFDCRSHGRSGDVWFGVPLFADKELQVLLDVVSAPSC